MRSRLSPLKGAAIALLLSGGAAMGETIGVASSILRDVSGEVGGVRRQLASGDGVSLNEVVATADESAAQLLFLDRSSLTIGENARLTLNRLVYDPDAGVGDVVARAIKGAFRFVSGLAGPGNYTVETPLASIGIRGSIVEGYIDEASGAEAIVLVQGKITICLASGVCVDLDRPGQYVLIAPDGSIEGPLAWPGPVLNLNAGLNFVKAHIQRELLGGEDPLSGADDANEVIDGLRVIDRFPPPPVEIDEDGPTDEGPIEDDVLQ